MTASRLRSVLYVSTSTIADDQFDATIERIVNDAIARNRPLDITGALLCTGAKFAQVMEGPLDSVALLMSRLGHDRHHRDIVVLEDITRAERRFGAWAMAYVGPSVFVARTVDRAVAAATGGSPRAVQKLVKLMRELSLIT